MDQLSIRDLARQTGLNPSAIRYFERVGGVPKPGEEGLRELDTGEVDTSSEVPGSLKSERSGMARVPQVRVASERGAGVSKQTRLFGD